LGEVGDDGRQRIAVDEPAIRCILKGVADKVRRFVAEYRAGKH
jgi:hypothetical protein